MYTLPEINCDLGEGILTEREIFPYIDSASIACGGHFGDEDSMNESITLARAFKKKIGAHPSYPDRENFGRKSVKLSYKELHKSLLDQIHSFERLADKAGMAMDHIKFHGALYNDAAANSDLADSLSDFIATHFHTTPIFTPPHSELEKYVIQKGLQNKSEVFGDRKYQENYQLVPRSVIGSQMETVAEISIHLKTLFEKGYLITDQGKKLVLKPDTICFHGDNPGIGEFLPLIRDKFWR